MATEDATQRITRRTLSDEVTERLRDDILEGRAGPGQRIVVSDLEKRFGVSHIPIREAFRRLETEGLLETSPKRATIVTRLALEDLHDLYALRRIIEGELAALAVASMTDEHLDDVARLFDQLAAAEASPEQAADLWTIHRDFHWAILAPALTPWNQKILEQLWQGADRYIRLHARFGDPEESLRQHRGLSEACARREPEVLRDLLIEHLTYSERLLSQKYLAYQADQADGASSDDGSAASA